MTVVSHYIVCLFPAQTIDAKALFHFASDAGCRTPSHPMLLFLAGSLVGRRYVETYAFCA